MSRLILNQLSLLYWDKASVHISEWSELYWPGLLVIIELTETLLMEKLLRLTILMSCRMFGFKLKKENTIGTVVY